MLISNQLSHSYFFFFPLRKERYVTLNSFIYFKIKMYSLPYVFDLQRTLLALGQDFLQSGVFTIVAYRYNPLCLTALEERCVVVVASFSSIC